MKLFVAVGALVVAEMMKLNALLETAFKQAPGSWTCRGTWTDPDGKSMTVVSKGTITKVLGGHQYTGEFSSPKIGDMPPMKSTAEWHYDPLSKGLVANMVCDSGDASRTTSSGLQGESIVWMGEGTVMGAPTKMRSTHTVKGPKEMTMVHEVEKDGAWTKTGEQTCRKL